MLANVYTCIPLLTSLEHHFARKHRSLTSRGRLILKIPASCDILETTPYARQRLTTSKKNQRRSRKCELTTKNRAAEPQKDARKWCCVVERKKEGRIKINACKQDLPLFLIRKAVIISQIITRVPGHRTWIICRFRGPEALPRGFFLLYSQLLTACSPIASVWYHRKRGQAHHGARGAYLLCCTLPLLELFTDTNYVDHVF